MPVVRSVENIVSRTPAHLDMARANLTVSEELAALFVDAQSGGVRCVFATVEGEELVSRGTCEASGTAKEDFPRACERLEDGEPRFVLYRLDSEGGDPAKWAFISYVPEETHVRVCTGQAACPRPRSRSRYGAQVRTKMLFASSADDFKRQLGPSFFTHEAHAADKVRSAPWAAAARRDGRLTPGRALRMKWFRVFWTPWPGSMPLRRCSPKASASSARRCVQQRP